MSFYPQSCFLTILSFLTLALTGQLWKKENVGESSYFTLQNSKSSKFLTAVAGNTFVTQGNVCFKKTVTTLTLSLWILYEFFGKFLFHTPNFSCQAMGLQFLSLFHLLYSSTSIVQCLEISRVQSLEISRFCTLEISRFCTLEISRRCTVEVDE